MSCYTAGLSIMYLDCSLGAELIFLNVEETAKLISTHLAEGLGTYYAHLT